MNPEHLKAAPTTGLLMEDTDHKQQERPRFLLSHAECLLASPYNDSPMSSAIESIT